MLIVSQNKEKVLWLGRSFNTGLSRAIDIVKGDLRVAYIDNQKGMV